MLSRHQTPTTPSSKLPSIPKSVAIADGGHNRSGRHGSDPFHGANTLAFFVLLECPLDPLIRGTDLGFQFDQFFVEGVE